MKELLSVAGKCVLVTDSTRGVGLMIARGLVEAKARVYISSCSSDACKRVAAELSLLGDLGSHSSIARSALPRI
jgi:NAD(P)-dependent dehydrogenase (short-subunit alcohol dehydrogenase family)